MTLDKLCFFSGLHLWVSEYITEDIKNSLVKNIKPKAKNVSQSFPTSALKERERNKIK